MSHDEWYTPSKYVEPARNAYKAVNAEIDFDPYSSDVANNLVRASKFYTKEDDALTKSWPNFLNYHLNGESFHGSFIWANPPYTRDAGTAKPYLEKIYERIEAQDDSSVVAATILVNSNTDSSWWQQLAGKSSAICFVNKRIRFFEESNTDPSGSARSGSSIHLIVRGDFLSGSQLVENWIREYSKIGFVGRSVEV